MAYRWEHTDAALTAQLELDAEGHAGAVGPGPRRGALHQPGDRRRRARHACAWRCTASRAGASTATHADVGSSVWQVFDGDGTFELDGRAVATSRGRRRRGAVVVPDALDAARSALDVFVFSDAPVYEALNLANPQ